MGARSPYYPYPVQHVYLSLADYRDQLVVTLQQERARAKRASEVLSRFITHLQNPEIDWEYEYKKEESKRWWASFDLTKGRLLAMQARYLKYLAATVEFERVLSPASNKLTPHPTPTLRNPTTPPLAEEAMRVLNRCTLEDSGKPWENLAHWELEKPFGLGIEQGQVPKPPPRMVSGSRRSPQ